MNRLARNVRDTPTASRARGIARHGDAERSLRASSSRVGTPTVLWIALRVAIATAALALFALKIHAAFTLAVNSDEPQHLHVLWGWTTGLLPYRDLFDNQTPLFQLLWSPLLALFGERADIVPLMRLTVLPLYGAALWLTWRIAATLWSRRVAVAAVAITALCPPFFAVSTQFRPDDLWAVLWLATVYAAIGGRLDARRGFVTGLLAGAALATSVKALPLLVTAGVSALLLGVVTRPLERAPAPPWPFVAAFAAGLILLPGAFALFFFANDAGPAMIYALFLHVIVSGLGRWQHDALRFILAPLTLPLALYLVLRFRPRHDDRELWMRRSFVLLAASGYLVTLYGYWPLFTRQDLLPAIPFAAMAIGAWLPQAGARSLAGRGREAAVAFVIGAELVMLFSGYPLDAERYAPFERRLARVLALTRPTDHVLDAKGDSIFRPRPTYWVFESITLARLREGSIVDDIPAQLARTSTPVVIADGLPDAYQRFIDANYLAIGDGIRVAGLHLGELRAGEPRHLDVAIPLEYAAVTRRGPAAATIDGHACVPSCMLATGGHTLVPAMDGDVALVWADALARGLHPPELFVPPPG